MINSNKNAIKKSPSLAKKSASKQSATKTNKANAKSTVSKQTKSATTKKAQTKKTSAAKAAKIVAKTMQTVTTIDSSTSDQTPQKVVEEVTLNWTDLTGAKTGAKALGSNKFYKAKIEAEGNRFKITFNYGRVGQSGQVQIAWAETVEAARRTFHSKINAKIAKGYCRVEMRKQEDEVAKAKAKGIEFEKPVKKIKPTRSFHQEIENLLRVMYTAAGNAVRAGLSSSAGVSKSAPLGNLHDTQLDKGADLLDEIEDLITSKKNPPRPKLIQLTNAYLSNIPRNIDHARKAGRLDLDQILLSNQERIAKERDFLGLLRDLYLQKEVFAEAAIADDPVEVWYDGLQCEIEWLEPDSSEFARIQTYFDKGQSPKNANFYNKLKVTRAWKLERKGEKPLFDTYASTVIHKQNATGLVPGWHGTRTENLMGISRSGLLMPENLPKGVHITGKAFGQGIYHAPCWPDAGEPRPAENGETHTRYNGALKSMNYTSISGAYYHTQNRENRGYLYLEELALGVPEVHLAACWDRKRPADGHDYIYARAFGNPQLSHDEVVTFDERASRLTHLLEIGLRAS